MEPLSSQKIENSSRLTAFFKKSRKGGDDQTKKKISCLGRIFGKRNKENLGSHVQEESSETHKLSILEMTFPESRVASTALSLLLPESDSVRTKKYTSWNENNLEADLETRLWGKEILLRKNIKFLNTSMLANLKKYLIKDPLLFEEVIHLIPDLMLKDPFVAATLLEDDFDQDINKILHDLVLLARDEPLTDQEREVLDSYLTVSNDKEGEGLSTRQRRVALLYEEFCHADHKVVPPAKVNISDVLAQALYAADQIERFSRLTKEGLELVDDPLLTADERACLSELKTTLMLEQGRLNPEGIKVFKQQLALPLEVGQLRTFIKIGRDLLDYKAKGDVTPEIVERPKRRGKFYPNGYFISFEPPAVPRLFVSAEVVGIGAAKKVKAALYLNENRRVSLGEVNMRTVKKHSSHLEERMIYSIYISKEFDREQEILRLIHSTLEGKAYVIMPGENIIKVNNPSVMISELYDSAGISSQIVQASLEVKGRIAHAWALGLMQIHEAGFVHADFKPDNTLLKGELTFENPDLKVVITDFGFSVEKYKESIRGGSPLYKAPELRSDPYYLGVPYMDCWSLGISILELLLPTFKENLPDNLSDAFLDIACTKINSFPYELERDLRNLRTLLTPHHANRDLFNKLFNVAETVLKVDPTERNLKFAIERLERINGYHEP